MKACATLRLKDVSCMKIHFMHQLTLRLKRTHEVGATTAVVQSNMLKGQLTERYGVRIVLCNFFMTDACAMFGATSAVVQNNV